MNAIDQQLSALGSKKASEDEGVPFQLEIANSVWGQQGYDFKQAYLDLLATQYGAGIHVVDFRNSSEQARQLINDWVAENTNERIKEIAAPGSISSDTRLVLANAILFKASWMYKFEPESTANGNFTLLDGTQVTTPLMHVKAPLNHIETSDYQAVRLPYANWQAEMWVIMPAEGRFEVVQNELSTDFIHRIEQEAGMDEVNLTFPSFEFESELSLIDLLMQLDLTDAFCPAGDYRGIAEEEGLCIGEAVHKATIMVNEEGTEATAATMVVMPAAIMQEIEMTVNRPFMFAIVAQDSGMILFLGQVLDPTAQ
jgi:serpin B